MSRFAPLQQRRDVWLNDLAFSNVDDLGNRWVIKDIDGWWDLPPMDMGEVDRAYSEDGSYYEPGRYSSRAIRLTGSIIPPNNSTNSANLARQEFNKRLMLVRKTGLLQVLESDELGGGKQSEVVTISRPLMKSNKLNGVIDFDVQFRAPDPRKYSVVLDTVEAFLTGASDENGRRYGLAYNRTYGETQNNNTALITNEGDYNTSGVIRLHGPIDDPGAQHMESNRYIKFTGVRLGVGQYIDVNLREKTIITESGISLRDRMDDGSRWFNFESGDSRVVLLGTGYLPYVPGVPDVTNIVTDPSFEGTDDGGTIREVRRNILPNPSGLAAMDTVQVRDSLFPDHQAQNPDMFSGSPVTAGVISGPSVELVSTAGGLFQVDDTTSHHFVQMEIKPNTAVVTSATLNLASRTSGSVPISSGTWTTVRVDSHIPTADYKVTLNLPGASATNTVQVRNIMVVKSSTPIAGVYPFWSPVEGIDDDGVVTDELLGGKFTQYFHIPEHWEILGDTESALRVIDAENDEDDGAYLIPATIDDHIVDFGSTSTFGSDITYGVVAEGLKEVRLYDADSDELLQTSVPSHLADNYISSVPVRVRLEATIATSAGGTPVRRKITATMVTFNGGTKIFTERTPDEDGYVYDYLSEAVPARESITSFVPAGDLDEYHIHATEVSSRAFDGARSLEIVYNIVDDDQENVDATPISRPDVYVAQGQYYARAKIMANKTTSVTVRAEGIGDVVEHTVSAGPHNWSDVSFPLYAQGQEAPFLTVTPAAGDRNVELYVDTVGILTDDVPYFDGSTPGPYTWSGAPHGSTSATIPVVGVPYPRMEIMYRNAWIG